MFDRVCKLSSLEQRTSRSAQSHTPKHKTITRREADTDRQEPVTQAQAYTLLRNEMRLLSYSIMKQNRPENHDHIPSHPDTPRPSPSLSHIYHPIYSAPLLLPFIYGPLSPLICPPYISIMHKPITEALSLSLSLICPLCLILAAFHSPPSAWKWIGKRKKEMKENASDAPTCIWLSISMVAWPPETAHHAPLHSKSTGSREGAKRGRV